MKEKLRLHLQEKAYFLILLPCFFILHGYNLFFGFFTFLNIIINFLGTALLACLVYFITYFIAREKIRRSILAFWITAFILFFRSLHDFLKELDHFVILGKYTIILPSFMLAMLLLALYLKRVSEGRRLFLFLNYLLLAFLLFESSISIYKLFQKENKLLKIKADKEAIKANGLISDSLKPDIYFIVFDGMPNKRSMIKINSAYNTNFYANLQKKNFKIQSSSLSNYDRTVFSLSSTFNMAYIDSSDAVYSHLQYLKALESIKKNRLTDFLKQQNYKVFQIQPLSNNNQDWQGQTLFSKLLSEHFFYETLFGCMYRDLNFHLNKFNFFKRKNTNSQIESIKQKNKDLLLTISKTKLTSSYSQTPKFVYAHLMIPHEPYVYDSNGNILVNVEKNPLTKENELSKFYEQALYAEKVALDLIDHLLSKNKKNTVIMIEGDHGFRSLYGNSNHLTHENLNAIYIPNLVHDNIYPAMSPVNTFRYVLNSYFDTRLPFLIDSSIFIPYSAPETK